MIVKTDTEIIDFTEMWTALRRWWDELAVQRIGRWTEKRKGLLLACPIYGDDYLATFNNYCLQSVYSGANLEALRGSALMLFTDRPGLSHIPQVRTILQPHEVDVVVRVIPDEIMKLIKHPLDHMWLLGVCHSMSIKEAATLGYDWHMLLADHCYSDGYFRNLIELGKTHPAIAQTSLSADIDAARPDLEKYRTEEGLVIPAKDLGTIAWKHLHKQMKPMVQNDRVDYIRAVWMLYAGQESVSIYSAHMNAAFLSNDLCVWAPSIIPATVDTQLPYLMGTMAGGTFYVPSAADGLTFIELSGPGKNPTKDEHLEVADWAYWTWNGLKFKEEKVPFLERRGEIPVHGLDGLPTAEIEARHAKMVADLRAYHPNSCMRFCNEEVK